MRRPPRHINQQFGAIEMKQHTIELFEKATRMKEKTGLTNAEASQAVGKSPTWYDSTKARLKKLKSATAPSQPTALKLPVIEPKPRKSSQVMVVMGDPKSVTQYMREYNGAHS
jgi:hypothetical protein